MKAPSIRRKILVGMFVTTVTALLISSTCLLVYELYAVKSTMAKSLSSLAKSIAANSSALLVYDDQKVAQEILSSLKSEPSVVSACFYRSDGSVYSTFPQGTLKSSFPPLAAQAGYRFSGGRLYIFEPVLQSKSRVGTLFVQQDLHPMYSRFYAYVAVVALVVLGSAGVALLVSHVFQRRLSAPILDLAGVAKKISEDKDFEVRASSTHAVRELDILTRAFNDMLAEIHRNAAVLEARVAQRTESLEETTRQLHDFCYSVAHDLKAPIRAQASYAQLLLDEFSEKLGTEGLLYTKRIKDAAERQSRLVGDLLEHASLGRSDLPMQAVNVRSTLQQVIDDLSVEITRQGATVEASRVDGLVIANPASLHLVLNNLLSNALKFVPKGERARVIVWTEPREKFVRIWVKDYGLGIPKEQINRLFSIFQRLHTREEYPGTGIGLAIVKRAVERMGGQVGVESQERKGSSFWVDLKAAPSTFL